MAYMASFGLVLFVYFSMFPEVSQYSVEVNCTVVSCSGRYGGRFEQ
jgi:hypothetical protein